MSIEYDKYIRDHKDNVLKGLHWCIDNIPELFDEVPMDDVYKLVVTHDSSKWTAEEYDAYDNYFYGKKTAEVKTAFDLAWLHHQNHNPHHWQYWLLKQDDGEAKALPMPIEYCVEMVLDWWSFSWKKEKLTEIFDWYETNKPNMVLHKDTVKTVERLLDLIRDKVYEVDGN